MTERSYLAAKALSRSSSACSEEAGLPLAQYLDQDVLHHLGAVIVHADVTREGLAQEDVSAKTRKEIRRGYRRSKHTVFQLRALGHRQTLFTGARAPLWICDAWVCLGH